MIKQDVEMTDGKFILEIPLRTDYIQNVKHVDDEEFTHLRYTAITSPPDEFSGIYSLRAKQKQRRTKIAVVCTMYNEDDQLLSKTLSAVMDNIEYLCNLKGRKGWDSDSWKDIVVVIVSDGRSLCDLRSLDVLGAMGCYLDGLPRSQVDGIDVKAHLFEVTTQARIDQSLEPTFCSTSDDKVYPMQTIFLLKEKNEKKINSHRWFFNGICQVLDPEVCILLDVGTRPTKQSFYQLYRAFERDPNVAGACGEIAVEMGLHSRNLKNPLVAVQNFEYKMSNILDKPLESVLGYISVLPGAFSAYRFHALQGKPLETYFRGEALHNQHAEGKPNVSESNMYLAEDRILCFELVMKAGKKYTLKYVKSAKAETDVPTEIHDFIKQRRRWLNGSFFASVYSVTNFTRFFLVLLFSWFTIGSIYICFYFMFNTAPNSEMAACRQTIVDMPDEPLYPYGPYVSSTIRGIYVTCFIMTVVGSLGNKPETIKGLLTLVTIIYGIFMVLMLLLIAWTIMLDIHSIPKNVNTLMQFIHWVPSNPNFMNLAISLLCTYGMFIFSSILYLDPWHPITCLLQYLLMTPSFYNVLMVYAFCNIHDISWGTKGQDNSPAGPNVQISKSEKSGKQVATTELPTLDDEVTELVKLKEMSDLLKDVHCIIEKPQHKKSPEDHFKSYRTHVLLWWFITNFALVFLLTNEYIVTLYATPGLANPFLVFLLWSVAVFTAFRLVGAIVYWFQWTFDVVTDFF
ncbi:UNVERIFIED_CONTAM: Chitin synthase, class 2 [Siphonaria sp. JEL0065]|nr:Chitin synthase, class 2 [Siphonaria sp. JEL0065]